MSRAQRQPASRFYVSVFTLHGRGDEVTLNRVQKTTLGFCSAFFFLFFFFCKETKDNDEQTSKNIKAIIMITTNRLSGAAVNTKGWMNEDVQAAVNK